MNVASPEPGTPAVSALDRRRCRGQSLCRSGGADQAAPELPVVLTTLAGYYMGSAGYDLARLFHTVVGTALVAVVPRRSINCSSATPMP